MSEKPFAVGDKVVLFGGFGGEPVGFDVVKAVTEKRGDVTLEKSTSKYDQHGHMLPRQTFSRLGIGHAEPKHYEFIERRNILYRLEKLNDEALSLEELRQINAIIKPHWDKQKAEEKKS